MTAGAANSRQALHRNRSAHGHAGDIAPGQSADIQVAHIHGRVCLFICISYCRLSGVFDAVYANRHHPCQEGIRPGELQGRRPGLQGGRSIRFHVHQGAFCCIAFVNGSILQPCRSIFEYVRIRPDTLGGKFCITGQADAYSCSCGFGIVRCGRADGSRRIVFTNRGNIRVVNLRANRLSAVACVGTLVAFRQGHANPQRYSSWLRRQFAGTRDGSLACFVCSLHRHRRSVGNCTPLRFRRILMPVFIFPNDGNGIVMAPVYGKVAVGRHSTVIFISCRRACRKSQRIGFVVRIQGNGHAVCNSRTICCRLCLDPVIGGIHAGGVIHPVIGNT